MTHELTAQVVLNEGLQFTGTAGSGYAVTMDAPVPAGHGAGFMPMELVLISLAGCSAMDVLAILRKKEQNGHSLDVRVRSQRQNGALSVFTGIALEYIVWGEDIDPTAVARAIELSADHYCPVWKMLEKSVTISSTFRVMSDAPILVPAD